VLTNDVQSPGQVNRHRLYEKTLNPPRRTVGANATIVSAPSSAAYCFSPPVPW
jgi:hypothetical protein